MRNFFMTVLMIGGLLSSCNSQNAVTVNGEKMQLEDGLYAHLSTNKGDILIKLAHEKAPLTTANFVALAEGNHPLASAEFQGKPFYDGLIFHRVIPNFMAQTGGFNEGFIRNEPFGTVINESIGGLPNITGSVAMARTSDPDSASSQFYINVANNNNLNAKGQQPGYTVFATVIEGQDIAPKITQLPQGQHANKGYRNAPNQSVIITSAKRIKPRKPLAFEIPTAKSPQQTHQ